MRNAEYQIVISPTKKSMKCFATEGAEDTEKG
jgi:hypothetical protein